MRTTTCRKCGASLQSPGGQQRYCVGCNPRSPRGKHTGIRRNVRKDRLTPETLARRDALVLDNLKVAEVAAAKVYARTNGHVEYGDLLSGAFLGLMDAGATYKTDRNTHFTTFATHRCIGAALDANRAIDRSARLQRTRAKRFEAASDDFYKREGRQPTDDELRAEMGLTEDRYDLERVAAFGGRFIDAGPVFMNRIAPPAPADDTIDKADWWDAMTASLSPRDRAVVLAYYRDGQTLVDVGRDCGLTESGVSQLLKKLRGRMQSTAERITAAERGDVHAA